MDPRVITTLKLAVFGLLTVFLIVFAMKHYKRSQKKAALASEMRTLVSDTSFYRSSTVEAAHASFLKGISLIEQAKEVDLEPSAYFDIVFRKEEKKDKVAFDDEFEEHPSREKLVRETLLRGYQQAGNFQLLATPADRKALSQGEMPDVTPKPVIACVIDPALSPGIEKIIPNLELRASAAANAAPTDLEIAAAKNLVLDLQSAQVIGSDVEKRITEHYKKAKQPAPAPAPAPAP